MSTHHLFLIGTGRSGTTLIQRIINTFPDTMIWGEHAGFLNKLSELYYFLLENPSLHEFSYNTEIPEELKFKLESYNDSKVWQAWTNWFRPDDINDVFRNILDEFFCPKQFNLKLWGFKEIRYDADDCVLEFLSEIYPDAIFLFMARDNLNNIESQLTTFHRGQSKHLKIKRLLQLHKLIQISIRWKNQNAYYLSLCKKYPDNHFLIRYEDAIDDLSILDPILTRLNLKIGDQQKEILKIKEGRGSNFKLDKTVNTRWKRMGIIPALIAETITGSISIDLGYRRPSLLKPATSLSRIFFR